MLSSTWLVDLQDPRTEGSRFKTFTTYNVVSTLSPAGVRRRYSDFEWLRSVLKGRYHGRRPHVHNPHARLRVRAVYDSEPHMQPYCCVCVCVSGVAIPWLPEKKVIGNTEQDFVEERMRGLASFIRNLFANPYLLHDSTLRLFLTVADTGAGEWEQSKRVCTLRPAVVCLCVCVCVHGIGAYVLQAVNAGEGSFPTTNPGLNQWFGVLCHLVLPAVSAEVVAALGAHLAELEKGLSGLQLAFAKYVDVSAKLADALAEITVRPESPPFRWLCLTVLAAV